MWGCAPPAQDQSFHYFLPGCAFRTLLHHFLTVSPAGRANMRPSATDVACSVVSVSVCLYSIYVCELGTRVSCARLDRSRCCSESWLREYKEPCVRWGGSRSPAGRRFSAWGVPDNYNVPSILLRKGWQDGDAAFCLIILDSCSVMIL